MKYLTPATRRFFAVTSRNPLLLAVAAAAFSIPGPLLAATPTLEDLASRVKSLELDNQTLRERLGVQDPAASAKPAKAKTAAAKKPADAPSGKDTAANDTDTDSSGMTRMEGTKSIFAEVPDSPSAAILGVTPQKIVRPSNPADIIGAIVSGLDEHGNFQSGLAVDISAKSFFDGLNPHRLPDPPSGKLVMENYVQRVLGRTQLSLVIAKGATDDDKSLRGAIGVQTTLMDETDSFLRKYETTELAHLKVLNQLGVDESQLAHIPAKSVHSAWHYNSSWAVGAAGSVVSEDGSGDDLRSNGYAVYSTYSYGFEGANKMIDGATYMQRNDQLLLQLQYRDHDMVPDASDKGKFLDEDRFKVALRFRFGDRDLNASLDGTFMEERTAGGSFKPAYSVAFDVEKHLANNMWLTLSMGKEFDHDDGNNPVVVLGGVKLGYTMPGKAK